ncbi:hypothetical protein DFH07DRAFT_1059392 [Mycena maculata]|uniref:Uncharacterized protein n=1 Tax=Mycena maculata TaxID=230809 RepID=A0AAD7JIH7_9AGAR|nr:hypothetical protein DFH07DRAFT_1059392 [Mycena maculata]
MSSHFTSPHCCFALFECRLAFAFPRCRPQPSEHVSQKRHTFVMRFCVRTPLHGIQDDGDRAGLLVDGAAPARRIRFAVFSEGYSIIGLLQ